jgi:hypothetical protein
VTNIIANYRLISLLTSSSKICEKAIYKRLLGHITTKNLPVNEQFVFKSKLSAEMASYSLIEILDARNNRRLVGGIVCDLEMAFDCVNHSILLAKLKFYGISGKAYTVIKYQLENKHHRVTLNNKCFNFYSSWGVMKYGFPQGSILGPLFFGSE